MLKSLLQYILNHYKTFLIVKIEFAQISLRGLILKNRNGMSFWLILQSISNFSKNLLETNLNPYKNHNIILNLKLSKIKSSNLL